MALTSSSSSSSSSSSCLVRVLEKSRVSPPPGSVPQVSVPLTYLDANWLFADIPAEDMLHYHLPQPATFIIDSVVPKLKSSLSLTLQHFYPLAGNLRRCPGTDDKYAIHCKDGDSVSFTVAESDADFYDLSGHHAREFHRIHNLVPQLPRAEDSEPLFAVQITLFPNSGVTIAVAMHHAASDGSGLTHFIKSWAASYRSGGSVPFLPPPPLIDRSVIPDPHGLYSHILAYRRLNPIRRAPSPAQGEPLLCAATFVIGTDDIRKLKQLATATTHASFHPSTFVVACAYAWVCLAKALKYPRDAAAIFSFPMDIRASLIPDVSISAAYLGNCVRLCHAEAEVGELLEDNDGLGVAAEAIGRAIGWHRRDVTMESEIRWRERRSAARSAGRVISVVGSPKLRIYDADFGWGRPAKVEFTSLRSAALLAMSLAESRDEPGGVEIGLLLPRDVMLRFSSCFSSRSQVASNMIRSSL